MDRMEAFMGLSAHPSFFSYFPGPFDTYMGPVAEWGPTGGSTIIPHH